MIFLSAPTSENYPVDHYVSEGSLWECGIVPMLFGCRIRLSLVDAEDCALDYCAGAETPRQYQILDMVMRILLKVPEDTPRHVVEAMFPRYHIKPIFKDKECWIALNAASSKAVEPATCPEWLKARRRKLATYPPPTLEEVQTQMESSARVRRAISSSM